MKTDYHAKYYAYELTKKCSSESLEKFAKTLFEAKVQLNPHQIDATLFAFKSPFSKGAILADEVDLGKTIEAGIVISQYWAEDRKNSLEIALKRPNKDIKTLKTEAKKIIQLEEKLKVQRQIKDMEANLKQKIEETELFLIRWRLV